MKTTHSLWIRFQVVVSLTVVAAASAFAQPSTTNILNNFPSEVITSFAPANPPPDPSDDFYNSVFEQTNTTAILFNNVTGPTRNVVIDGIVVVIDDSIPGGYWDRYNGAPDINQFTINAETVIFRSALSLPGTTVNINCANLSFEANPAHNGMDNAVLNVTPVAPLAATAISQNGSNGQAAGNINLNIGTFNSDASGTNRLIAQGGQGGNPGPGGIGLNGQSLPDATQFWNNVEPNGAAGMPNGSLVYIDYQYACKKCNPSHQAYYGTGAWPTSGGNGIPAGKPGNPGPAGTIATTIDVSQFSQLTGGISGTQGPTYAGGTSGQPTTAFWAVETYNTDGGPYWSVWAGPSYATNGTTAVSPPADIPVGTNGIQFLQPGCWQTSGYAQAMLNFAQDAYRSEYYTLAQSTLIQLTTQLASATNSTEAATLLAIQGQAQTLLHRLAAGKTYWGWAINYAPLLSFQISDAAFTTTINNSIYVIYLDQLLHSANRSISDKLAAVQATKQNAIADLTTQANTIQSTLITIPTIQQEAAALNQQITQVQTDQQIIAQLEIQEAETEVQNAAIQAKTPLWQTILRAGEAIADFTPYGPATTAVVNGAININNDLNNINSTSAWLAIPDLTSAITTAFATGTNTFFTAGTTLENQINGLNPTAVTNWGVYLTNLQAFTAPIRSGVTNLENVMTSTPILSSQVQSVLNNIKATDPTLSNLATQLNNLMQEKQTLTQDAATAMQTISTAEDQIQADLLAINACEQQLNTGAQLLSHDLLQRVDAIANTAMDNINKFQAITAAAYRFQTLSQYPGNLQLDDIVQQIEQLAQTEPVNINPTQFGSVVSLYQSDLAEIADSIVAYYDNNFAPLQTQKTYKLDQTELTTAQNGVLKLNLARTGIFPPNQTDLRIIGINFGNIQATIPAGYQIDRIATLTVNIQNEGTSTIADNNGNLYQFYHYSPDAPNPVSWSATIDLANNVTNIAIPSPLVGSLIQDIVGLPTSTVQDVFAPLGADSELDITVQAYSDNGIPIQLSGLTLNIEYEYENQPSSTVAIEVLGPNDNTLPIGISTSDLQQRTNGVTPFMRSYAKNAGSTIQLTAPTNIENQAFANWVDQFGNTLGTNVALTLNLGASQIVTPMYQPAPSVFGLAMQGQTVVLWPTPTNVTYGATLNSNILNAVANMPGQFLYSPAIGTTPSPGTNTLTVVFTPTNGSYNTVTNSVSLVVTSLLPTDPRINATINKGQLLLNFKATANSAYIIQNAPSPKGPWSTVATVNADASGNLSFTNRLTAGPAAQFFRAMSQ